MKIKLSVVCYLMLVAFTLNGDYYPQENYLPRPYDNARLVRVNYGTGEAYVIRSFEQGWEEAVPNLPVFDRDIVGTTDGRLEIYLGRMNFLRIDYDGEIIIEEAPRLGRTRTTVRVVRGGIYLNVNQLDFRRDIQIQTPDCGIFILRQGRYRINVYNQGGTEIQVQTGLAEVAGEYRGHNLGSRYAMVMVAGDYYQMPYLVDRYSLDDFEMWNAERNRLVYRSVAHRTRYLDPVFAHYEYELSRLGRWIYQPSYQMHVWVPSTPGRQWRPYYRGRWIYHPVYGYVWNSYDSWGWITHHYGRWHWSPNHGWYWIPGKKWAPAWVVWSWTENYYGWCPLSMNNRPVIVVNNRWIRDYRFRSGLPLNSSSMIVVRKDSLWAPKIHRVALSGREVMNLSDNRINFRGRHPKMVPKPKTVRVVNAKGKPVVYKKRGFLSPDKYRVKRTPDQNTRKKISRYSQPHKRIPVKEQHQNKYREIQKSRRTFKPFEKKVEPPKKKADPRIKHRKPVKRSGDKERKTITPGPAKKNKPAVRETPPKKKTVPVQKKKAVKKGPGSSKGKKKEQSTAERKSKTEKNQKRKKGEKKKKKDDDG